MRQMLGIKERKVRNLVCTTQRDHGRDMGQEREEWVRKGERRRGGRRDWLMRSLESGKSWWLLSIQQAMANLRAAAQGRNSSTTWGHRGERGRGRVRKERISKREEGAHSHDSIAHLRRLVIESEEQKLVHIEINEEDQSTERHQQRDPYGQHSQGREERSRGVRAGRGR
jgi:hypothetical protein